MLLGGRGILVLLLCSLLADHAGLHAVQGAQQAPGALSPSSNSSNTAAAAVKASATANSTTLAHWLDDDELLGLVQASMLQQQQQHPSRSTNDSGRAAHSPRWNITGMYRGGCTP